MLPENGSLEERDVLQLFPWICLLVLRTSCGPCQALCAFAQVVLPAATVAKAVMEELVALISRNLEAHQAGALFSRDNWLLTSTTEHPCSEVHHLPPMRRLLFPDGLMTRSSSLQGLHLSSTA